MTLITLGRERSGGQREEPLAAPPSPPPASLFGQEGSEGDLPRPIPPPPPPPPPPPHTPTARAPAPARATESASHWPACATGSQGARATPSLPPPPPSRAPARALPRLTLRGSGRVKSGSRAGGPISGAAAAAPSPPPVRPLGAGAYGLALAARAGPEAGSLGASRASGEWRGLRASWVASRALHLPRGSASAPGRTPLPHPPPRPAAPQPRRHLAWLRPVLPALLRPASAPASILGYSPGSPSTGHLPSTRWFRAEAKAAPLLP